MGGVTGHCTQLNSKCRSETWIVKAEQKPVERRGLHLGVKLWRILDGVGDSTEEVRGEDGAAQFAWQHSHTEREGPGHLGQNLATPAFHTARDRALCEIGLFGMEQLRSCQLLKFV